MNKLTGKNHEQIFPNDISHKNTADAMAKFYREKIEHLRSLIELSHDGVSKFNIPVSTVNFNRDNVCCMKKLTETTSVEILECIRKMKNKSCLSDPIPTFILKPLCRSSFSCFGKRVYGKQII